jgi:hypothetical protein
VRDGLPLKNFTTSDLFASSINVFREDSSLLMKNPWGMLRGSNFGKQFRPGATSD